MWSGIQSLDELRGRAAASGTGCISVSIEELNIVKNEIKQLRIAARLIHQRSQITSGSKEMADIDAYCKKIGLRVWKWPLGDFWDYENL